MPRTSTKDWIEPEAFWERIDEAPPYRRRRELVRWKSTTVERFARRTMRRKGRHTPQLGTLGCPYCQSHWTHSGNSRRKAIHQQFTQLAKTWRQETAHLSNIATRAMHPAYQRIIGMGREAIPFILEEFRQGELDDWFWALYAITGENPITEEIAGDVEKMAEAWLQWGRKTGYLSDSIPQMRPSSQT
jgi:hypothetical protein